MASTDKAMRKVEHIQMKKVHLIKPNFVTIVENLVIVGKSVLLEKEQKQQRIEARNIEETLQIVAIMKRKVLKKNLCLLLLTTKNQRMGGILIPEPRDI